LAKLSAKIYFSDFAGIPSRLLDKHGAFDVSLINDLPLFIDPFCYLIEPSLNIRLCMERY
jgi:hypothetical protein